MHKRAVIFANGELCNAEKIKELILSSDFLIAVDGGHHHMKLLGLIPDLVIGDLDSIQKKEVNQLQKTGVEIQQFPPEKDETDLELALREATTRDYPNILIVAGLGGRLDQTLGNLSLLKAPFLANNQIKLDDGSEEVWILKKSTYSEGLLINGEIGDVVSLLSFGSAVKGITTAGLKYPLTGENLLPYQTRGISNEMVEIKARVSLTDGELIVIHTRKNLKSFSELEVRNE
jgi:thiamine pyrophosphokinase